MAAVLAAAPLAAASTPGRGHEGSGPAARHVAAVALPLAAVPLDAGEREESRRLRDEARRIGGAPEAGDDDGFSVPGWLRVLGALAALLVLLGLVWGLVAGLRRRTPAGAALARPPRAAGPDPQALEAQAAAAVRAGEHDRAVLLRYRAALLRLRAAGDLPARPVTPREVARLLGERSSAAPGAGPTAASGELPAGGPAPPAAAADLAPLVDAVEQVAYRGRSVGARESAEAERWGGVRRERRA